MTDTQTKPQTKQEEAQPVPTKETPFVETDNYIPLANAIQKQKVATDWKAVFDTSFETFLKEAAQQTNAADMAEKLFMGFLLAGIIFPIKALEEMLKAKQESRKKTQQHYRDSLKSGLARSGKTDITMASELIRQASMTFRAFSKKTTFTHPIQKQIALFVKTLPTKENGHLDISAFSKRQKAQFNKFMYDYAIHSKRFHDTLGTASGIEFSLNEKKKIASLAISMIGNVKRKPRTKQMGHKRIIPNLIQKGGRTYA